MIAAGKVYLVPTVLSENAFDTLSPLIKKTIASLDYIFAEKVRTTRRFFSALNIGKPISQYDIEQVNKDTTIEKIIELFNPVLAGRSCGVLSESGCPSIADPGSLVVSYAHELEIEVVPLAGPSSIFLALMASGFTGQNFSFHGYLPIDKKEREHQIRFLEKESLHKMQVKIFIETPYRNTQLLKVLVNTCHPDTQLCVARDITGDKEYIRTMSVKKWKNRFINLEKIPVVFLLYAR